MKVTHLPGSLSRKGGGVFNVALHHCKELQKHQGIDVSVIGTLDQASIKDADLWGTIPTQRLKVTIPKIHQIQGLKKQISIENADVLHSHMLWTSQSRVLSSIRRPYIVSPHGMLDDWVMNKSKRLAFKLFEKKSLSQSACIHALNVHEYETLRNLGLKNPIAIIPNGIDFSLKLPSITSGKSKSKKTMLFLSRIDPKKGLENLLEAWSHVDSKGLDLDIYGWGNSKYVELIKARIIELGLQGSVKLKGEVHGDKKHEIFARADAFILPSFSEGFPMVVLEAWQHKLPVLLTDGCNMPEAFENDSGFRISNDPSEMAKEINTFLALSEKEKHSLGSNGSELAQKKYDWHIIGNSLVELYQWVLNGGTKPAFVMLK